MKRIIVTTIATLLLCSGSAAFAQSATAPQQPSAPASTSAPAIDVSKLTSNQREYLVVAASSQNPEVLAEQLTKLKQIYEQLPPDQQLQMVTSIAQQIQRMPQATQDHILNNMPQAR